MPTWGNFTLLLQLDGVVVARFSDSAACAPDLVPLAGGRCGCASGFFQRSEDQPCEVCMPSSTSSPDGAVGKEDCAVCKEGFYRPTAADDAASKCVACLHGALCDFNTTLETLRLADGFWRLSPSATRLLPCSTSNGSAVACVGGNSSGSCAPGYGGPLCAVCTRPNEHNEAGVCVDCPSAAGPGVSVAALLVGGVLAVGGLWWVYVHPPRRLRHLSWVMHAAAGTVAGFGWGPKLRILIAFYQCVTAIGPLYLVPLPSEYQEILDAFDFLNTDWLGFMLPAECVGSFESRMLLSAAAPLLLVVIIIVGELVAHGRQRKPLKGGLLSSISPCLLVVFIFAPGVNRKIFEAWDCVPYELSSTQSHYFLRRSPLIRCSSSEHDSLLALAYTLVVIWPVGSVALFTMLIAWVHRRLVSYRRDEFILATQFLHAPFTPEHSFWSSVELAQRCILTGWVLLIRADKSFMRLVFALLTALIVLVCTLTLHPYRRADDNMLAVASSLLLLLVYTASIFIKAFEDFNLAVTSLYLDAALTPRVLGFSSTGGIATLLVMVALFLLAQVLVFAFFEMRREMQLPFLRLKESGQLPTLTLNSVHQRWHLFISHVWSSAQDQAAIIKRQLQRMLPLSRVFLDGERPEPTLFEPSVP